MVGFIKKLLTGIISFFTGLVSGKKSEENEPSKLSPAEKLAEATTKTSKETLSSFTSNKSEENKPATDKAEKLAANAKKRKRNGYFIELDESEEMPSVNGNQPAKVETAKTPEPAKTAKTAKPEPAKTQSPADKSKTVELVQTATEVKEVVKTEPAKPAAVASSNGQASSENTFAPKYLTPTNSNSRRRPGPSMNNFLNMARQVKTAK